MTDPTQSPAWRRQFQETLRARDGDFYLTHLFFPAELRDRALLVFDVYADIARIPHEVSEPMLGLIRLQWWRDLRDGLVAGETRGVPLAEAWLAQHLSPDLLVEFADARGPRVERIEGSMASELEAEARAAGGALFVGLGALLGGAAPELCRKAGQAVELSRLVPEAGDAVRGRALELLGEARAGFNALPRPTRKALLPLFLSVGLAARHMRVWPARPSPFRPFLSLMWMAVRGRI